MKLTWRDAATVPFMAAIVVLYIAHLRGGDGWLVASTRGNATAILILGTAGGWALGSTNELFQGTHTPRSEFYSALAALLGLIALTAGLVTLIAASGPALATLFGATMALWLLAIARHSFATTTPSPGAELGPDTHEVIEQPPVRH